MRQSFSFPLRALCLTGSLLLAQHTAMAADSGTFSLGTGFNYTSGTYGTSTTTNTTSIPVIGRYDTGPWTLKLTVPYVYISGDASVLPGLGRVGNTNPRNRGTSSAQGLGDVVAAATYALYDDRKSGLGVDLTGKIKFGTGDRDKGLGTGENDYAAQVDVFKTMGQTTVFGGIGYTVQGSSLYTPLNNVMNLTAGVGYQIDTQKSAGVAYDAREKASATGAARSELTLYYSQKLDRQWKAQAYVLKGFADGSPDWGGGASITRAF